MATSFDLINFTDEVNVKDKDNESNRNPVYFQMQGMRQEYNDIQDFDTSASPYMDIDKMPTIDERGALDLSSYNQAKGDWDFTEQQKRDLSLNGRVDDIFERPEIPKDSPLNTAFKTSNNMEGKKNVPSFSKSQISQLSGNMAESEVSVLFFSKLNIQALQDGIRNLVYKRSNQKHKISEQSINELVIVMKSIFLQEGQNLMYNVVEQVRYLNTKVLDYCVPEILKELDMYEKYMKDLSSLPVPIDRAVNVSSKGDKVLEFTGFF